MKVKKESSVVDYLALGRRIAQKRKEQKLSQEQLAELADITPTNLSHIERGKTKGSIDTVVSIANALGVTADVLLCDSLASNDPRLKDVITSDMDDLSTDELRLVAEIAAVVKGYLRREAVM